jgi:hypothetical protein
MTVPSKMNQLTFMTNASSLIVGGATFFIKETLKLHGAKWDPQFGSWSLPIAVDSPGLRMDFEELVTKRRNEDKVKSKADRAAAKTPAAIAALNARNLAAAAARGWTCCENAYVMDNDRGHVGCNDHGFFVKGILRTGD